MEQNIGSAILLIGIIFIINYFGYSFFYIPLVILALWNWVIPSKKKGESKFTDELDLIKSQKRLVDTQTLINAQMLKQMGLIEK